MMTKNGISAFCLSLAILASGVSASFADWEYKNPSINGHNIGLGPVGSNQDNTILMSVNCNNGQYGLTLWFQGDSGWNFYTQDADFVIDGKRIAMRHGGEDFFLNFSDHTDGISITPGLITMLKSGNTLVIKGASTAKMSKTARTFSLKGSTAVLKRAGC